MEVWGAGGGYGTQAAQNTNQQVAMQEAVTAQQQAMQQMIPGSPPCGSFLER